MAVEKMKIISIVGKRDDLDKVSRLVVLNGNVHMLNALSEINANYFELEASEDHIQAMQELSDIKPYINRKDFSKYEEILKAFHKIFDINPSVNSKYLSSEYDYEKLFEEIAQKYDTVREICEGIDKKLAYINKLQEYIDNISYLKHTGLDIRQLMSLEYMDFQLIMLSKENFLKLKLNYENIPSAVFQVYAAEDNSIVAAFTPKSIKEDTERIFESLNYKSLELPLEYKGIAEEITGQLSKEIEREKQEIAGMKASAADYKKSYSSEVIRAYSLLELEKKVEHVKSEVAIGQQLFFLFGFVPVGKLDEISNTIRQNSDKDIIIITEEVEKRRAGHAPPTKLKNNRLFKPFELLISMYGTPSYNEADPTPFFALSYMLLFGAMFGDIGQGLVILLGGLFIKYKLRSSDFGGIISRLGVSSMFFGLLYGSIFGNEHIIHGLWIKPMDNINSVLISAIILGVVLINIGYMFSLSNLYQRRDFEEGVFGREGIVGYLFFWTLLLTVLSKATDAIVFPMPLAFTLLGLLLMIMVFKQPLANKIKGHKVLYEEPPGDYYIEAGFGIIETLLSILSNVISFIRVGAFALNHVGLYIAFATMAKMVGSAVGGFVVLVIGNIVIIGLEGLIVFIQSLRLEYYELFSKYYTGYGIPYKPARVDGERS